MNDTQWMAKAIEVTRVGIAAGQAPFGAVIVKRDALVAETHNTVWRDVDPTAHAETNGIRQASAALKSIDLSGCTIYSTCEPCPMCLAAIHWAKLDRVVFGATIADAEAAGFQEMPIAARTLAELGRSRLKVEGGVLRDECSDLFTQWLNSGKVRPY